MEFILLSGPFSKLISAANVKGSVIVTFKSTLKNPVKLLAVTISTPGTLQIHSWRLSDTHLLNRRYCVRTINTLIYGVKRSGRRRLQSEALTIKHHLRFYA